MLISICTSVFLAYLELIYPFRLAFKLKIKHYSKSDRHLFAENDPTNILAVNFRLPMIAGACKF